MPSGPATPRQAPYVWVTWTAEMMVGVACEWRYWLKAHNYLNEKASVFDDPAWYTDHTNLLSKLEGELRGKGLKPEIEFEIKQPIDKKGAVLAGKADCLVVDDRYATVFDCKTGKPKPSHQVQVMLYIWCLSKRPRFRDLGLRGALIYPDHREPVDGLSANFEESAISTLEKLIAPSPPRKAPGSDCRFCDVSSIDCPERQEWVEGDLPDEDIEPLLG